MGMAILYTVTKRELRRDRQLNQHGLEHLNDLRHRDDYLHDHGQGMCAAHRGAGESHGHRGPVAVERRPFWLDFSPKKARNRSISACK